MIQAAAGDTRLHPIVAFRAMRNLTRDKEDTRQVFLLLDALRGKTSLRQFERFCQSETGKKVLAERRSLLDRLSDRGSLAALPAGTLGRAYYDFTAAEHLSAAGLVQVSNLRDTLPPGEDMTLFRERSREMHDLLHTVTGYGRDPLGEACLTGFTFAQTGLKGFAVIALVSAQRIARACPRQPIRRAVLEGYRHGKRAAWLVGADWENLLTEPVNSVRGRYGIVAPAYYRMVREAIAGTSVLKHPPADTAAVQ